MNINEMRKSRADMWDRIKGFVNEHEDENGRLSVEDKAIYDNMMADMDKLSDDIDRKVHEQEIEDKLNAPANERIFDKVGAKKAARATDEYKAAFLNYIKTRKPSNVLEETNSSAGGYLVPVEFERALFAGRDKVDPIFDMAGRLFLGALEKNVPYVASRGAASIVEEGGQYPDTDDSFGQVVFHAYKYGRICKATDELIADNVFDIFAYLADSLGRALGEGQAADFWTGTGTGEPLGVMNCAGAGVTAAAPDKIIADELIDLYYSLDEQYRNVASWAMKDSTVKEIRKMKLGTGEYLWAPGFNGAPDTILGRPLRTSVNIDAIGAGKKVIAFGDFLGCYKIADRQGFEFKVLDQKYADYGQVGFRGSARSDGRGILASEGIKVLTMKA